MRYLVICDDMDSSLEEELIAALKLFSPNVIQISQFVWAISSSLTPAQIYDKLSGGYQCHIRLVTHFNQCFPVDFDLHKFLNESH